jgi:hypothetical protein
MKKIKRKFLSDLGPGNWAVGKVVTRRVPGWRGAMGRGSSGAAGQGQDIEEEMVFQGQYGD